MTSLHFRDMAKVWASVVLLSIGAGTASAGMKVTAWTGQVELLAHGGSTWAKVRETPRHIEPGDRFRAGASSTARIVLEDGTVLDIFARGDLMLQAGNELAQVVELRGGAMRVTLAREGSAGLTIRTAAGSLLPKWGEFFVSIEHNGKVFVKAKQGSLKLRSTYDGVATLSPGEMVLLSTAAASPRPETAPPTPALPPRPARPAAADRAIVVHGGGVLELLEALQADPDGLDIRAELNTKVTDSYLDHVRRFGALEAPVTPEARSEMLRRTYRHLAVQVEDEAVQEVFLQGQSAFESGRYFTAAERFLFCRLLRPRDAWVGEALEEYLARQLPARVSARASAMRAETAQDYRAAFASLLRRDWLAAAEELRRVAAETGKGPGVEGTEPAEFSQLASTLRARAAGREDAAGAQTRTMEIIRAGEADPEGAVEAIERMLLRFNAQAGEAWWQKASEGLRRAYANRELYRMTISARALYQKGDFKSATKVLVALLQRSPGHPGAMDLLEKIQARYEESTAQTRRAEDAARRAEEAARVAVRRSAGASPEAAARTAPPVVAREETPDLKALIQAEAYYQRGLKAYLHGDLQAASEEWRAALRLNSKHEASSRALSRVVKELDGAKSSGGGT